MKGLLHAVFEWNDYDSITDIFIIPMRQCSGKVSGASWNIVIHPAQQR